MPTLIHSEYVGGPEIAGWRDKGFIVESVDESTCLLLLMLIKCDQLLENRAEITKPLVVKFHSHLKSLNSKIPPLDLKAKNLLLLGRDIIRAHKVLEQRNGAPRTTVAQWLGLTWVILEAVYINGAHIPSLVNSFRTYVLENGCSSLMSPCLSKINVRASIDCISQLPKYSTLNQ